MLQIEGCYHRKTTGRHKFKKHKSPQNKDGINYNGQIELAHGVNVFNCQALELIKPEVGKFILFPNYMLHTVYPFYGPGERRSFSFNADIAIKK